MNKCFQSLEPVSFARVQEITGYKSARIISAHANSMPGHSGSGSILFFFCVMTFDAMDLDGLGHLGKDRDINIQNC